MKSSRFDTIAMAMAEGKSRRGLLKAVFGTAAGGAMASIATRETSAAGRATGETCRKGTDCASGTCDIGSDGRRRCCGQQCYNCGLYNTETCCNTVC